MPMDIKIRLMKLKRSQLDLLDKLNKRGFGTLSAARLNTIINGRYKYGCAPAVLEESGRILTEWEKANESAN